ncbi:MAG: CarD family transcriptional regulator, partial [Terriglobia bacterium]
ADSVGCYSMRGGIIDVFPPLADWPFRIEFLGDQIESIREFDPDTQRSRRPVEAALILPLVENKISASLFSTLVQALTQRSPQDAQAAREPAWTAEYSNIFPAWEFFAPLAEPHRSHLFSLFESPLVVWDEAEEGRKHIQTAREAWANGFNEVRDMVPPRPRPDDLLLSEDEFEAALRQSPQAALQELEIEDHEATPGNNCGLRPRCVLRTQPAPQFHGNLKAFIEYLGARREGHESVAIALSTRGKIERLCETLREYSAPFTTELTDGQESKPDGLLHIAPGNLSEGVNFPDVGLALIGEDNLFGASAWGVAPPHEKSAVSRFISDLSDLKAGDYVVHVDHGIGLYQGLRQIEADGKQRDFMLLTYQDDAKLYVPLERLDLVDKYRSGSGADGAKPVLDRLGGASWARTKTRVKRALRDMTQELLRLYAERKMSGGAAFSPDTPWQTEFEDAFEYEETPDQLKALKEIKADLENSQPMDRLLCGDVGYGKTELAMRAAFKVVQDGRQVAVLAPTTVLAFQHFTTFKQRMAAFPVSIEMISRFRSGAQQKKVAADTREGKVDILIGT